MLFNHWQDIPDIGWRWSSFTPKQIASKGDGSIFVNEKALDALDDAAFKLGGITILSAYRDPIHNARVGGAPLSRHKYGDAFDIALGHQNYQEILEAMRSVGFVGFGLYNSFIHVDQGRPRQWDKRTRSYSNQQHSL